jgi:hypothetical protein
MATRHRKKMPQKPHLAAAVLCERVLVEKDEVVSAIRIVDSFQILIPANMPAGTKPAIELTALLSFKKATGDRAEKHQATLVLRGPSGQMSIHAPSLDFYFKPDPVASANLIVNINLPASEYGTFEIDVSVDGEKVTTMPFRLLEQTPLVTH